MHETSELFGTPIHVYTRAQAIEEGVLVAVEEKIAREAGFVWPVAMTASAWGSCVAVPKGCEGMQDVEGRLWDVLWMLSVAVRAARRAGRTGNELLFRLYVVKAGSRRPRLTTLKAVFGPGDHGEPTITIMEPNED